MVSRTPPTSAATTSAITIKVIRPPASSVVAGGELALGDSFVVDNLGTLEDSMASSLVLAAEGVVVLHGVRVGGAQEPVLLVVLLAAVEELGEVFQVACLELRSLVVQPALGEELGDGGLGGKVGIGVVVGQGDGGLYI